MRKCTVCGYTTTFVGECTRFKEHEDHCKTSRKTCIQKEREKYERDLEIMKAKFDKDIETLQLQHQLEKAKLLEENGKLKNQRYSKDVSEIRENLTDIRKQGQQVVTAVNATNQTLDKMVKAIRRLVTIKNSSQNRPFTYSSTLNYVKDSTKLRILEASDGFPGPFTTVDQLNSVIISASHFEPEEGSIEDIFFAAFLADLARVLLPKSIKEIQSQLVEYISVLEDEIRVKMYHNSEYIQTYLEAAHGRADLRKLQDLGLQNYTNFLVSITSSVPLLT